MPGVAFTQPEVLLVGALLIAATLVLSAAARHHLARTRRRVSLGLRTVMLSLLVLALAGFQLVAPVDRLTTVFVVDMSDSVGDEGRQSALAFLREAIGERPHGDRAAIVAFGREALVERLPAELEEVDRIASVPTRSASDIGAALRLAGALFPDDSQKRIVLISDGNDTTGRGQTEAALAAARGIQVETFTIGLGAADEVIVQRVHSPATAHVGEVIQVEATISSTIAQPATVRLYANGLAIGADDVELQPGLNVVSFETQAHEAGVQAFRVRVEATADTFSQNNYGDSHTIVKGEPRILLVSGSPQAGANLRAALESERRDVTELAPEQVPSDITGLASYDAIVLADVAAGRLGEQRMAMLQVYVRDLGRGLVMIGGPESYGAGGYKGTPVEATLPVDMDVRDRDRQPDIALVVVIDQSGSMDACHCNTPSRDNGVAIGGIPKVDIGKEAILRAVSALTARDEFGIVAFNENAQWVIRTAPLGNVGNVEEQIAGIKPDGQTNIFAGLSEAVASLEQVQATRRHIVLFTDGWSSSGSYGALLERMEAAGITLSTVGAGGGGANQFLSDLARQGGGRFYAATDPTTIPDIFLKETQQVSGQQIVEETFFPIQTSASPILDGLDGVPQLLGYNGSSPKPAAQTVFVSTRDDPVLATWQYGLGRAAAWTSDATGRWAANWVPWTGFNRFFAQLVAWTFPGEESAGIEAEFVTEGDSTRLRVQSVDADGSPRDLYNTIAGVTAPAPFFDTLDVRLDQVAPGLYEAPLGSLTPGAYALRIRQERPGMAALGRTVVLVAPTPAEYRLLGTNEPLLAALRGATGGQPLAAGDEAWRRDLGLTTAAVDLWPLLILLALLLWPLDVAVRRVSVSRGDLALARAWTVSRWRAWRGPARRPQPVGEMLAAKSRAGGRVARTTLLTKQPARTAEAEQPSTTAGPIASNPPLEQPPRAPEADGPDTLARLREAKRRARDRR